MRRGKMKILGKARISVKLAFLYMSLLLISWSIIFLIFYRVSDKNATDSAQALSTQTLNTVSKNISTLIDNTAYYSRIILSSSDITNALEKKDEKLQKESLHQFTSLVDTETYINGIYMWDMDSHGCSIDKNHVRILRTEDIRETNWYEEVRELSGSYCLRLNADRVLTQSSTETTVSLIRVVNNPTDYRPVGILMINMDLNAFADSYSGLDQKSIPDIYILDDTGKIVTSRAETSLPRVKKELEDGRSNKKVLFAQQDIDRINWKVLAGVRIENGLEQSGIGGLIFAMAMIFLALFCGTGYFIMKRYVADPLEAMAGSMNRMSGRKFEKIRMCENRHSTFGEMEILESTYNKMVDEIDALIEMVYEEEKIKRKAELNALQEQMKPHFLYNTIDAMGYLALSGKNEEVYDALEAFGSYYRILLSKGREMISVREEAEMVKDYLELQKLRYGDSLHYVLNVAPEIQGTFILKMVLQPLVENSVNHGIRPKETPGVVYVEGIEEDGYLKFTVEDDGVGMDEDKIRELNRENISTNEKSFGLRGTIERMRIFYESDIDYTIKSTKGRGTTIVLRIPVCYEGDEGHD
ncbi:Sensor histidine kinase YpdA [Blautia producta]|uniref:Sensor histidine kinase YpdA n=1 Tax=Blautia producta TaxID=33035 RepID=A0A4P6LVE5_9FIRM|nr:sensor histidine kinase [Blautia producta]QBE96009.1 Sensor histidine kinase YpdA [Blautia producta]